MNREKEIIKTSIVGIIGNILLVIAKIIIGIIASSISIIVDGINNLTDAISSIVTILGVKLSSKEPTKKHPYGYGRIEFLSSSIIGLIILFAGVMAIYESIKSLIDKEESNYSIYSLIILGIAIVIKLALGLYFRHKAKITNSDALKASSLDALFDALLSTSALVAAIISYFAGLYLEGYVGILIGLFIIRSAFEVLKESVSKIIGEKQDSEFLNEITKSILEVDEVKGVYDLIINNYGVDRNIGSVHVEVRDDISAKEIQELERNIAYLCYIKFKTIMTVGIYASNVLTEDERVIKEKVLNVVSNFSEVIQSHGFYVNLNKKIISIDIIISYKTTNSDIVYANVKEALEKEFGDYDIHLVLDKDYGMIEGNE